ncbi:TrbM/KikA/MpfK family conjugal transfer protein [Pseudomonas nitroreducens]|uniref:TrbM/KikA/MpfK family conjugal transfer protein n=1 Tax=Pseudomonas nitroreducens TaxID=46680 RepID=UPI003CC80FC3
MSIAKSFATAALAAGLIFTLPAQAKDPCATVLCLWGKLQGKGLVDNCEDPVRDYFDILVKKKGKIKWSDTANDRQKFLNSCPAADRDKAKQINSKFGRLSG